MGKILCFCSLGILSYFDVKEKMLPAALLRIHLIIAVVYQMLAREHTWIEIAGGIGIGVLFLVLSKITGEAIGFGDGWGIVGIGAYHGLWNVLEILLYAFGFLMVASIVLLVRSKMSKKCTLAFYPFLVMGYGVWCI